MTLYLPDTNVWVRVGEEADLRTKCDKALANGDVFLIAPPALIEVIQGMVRCGEDKFLAELAAQKKALDMPKRLSDWFGAPGCRPRPLVIERFFSAAIEYLETSIRKVASGAKPRKNDRGLYVDYL